MNITELYWIVLSTIIELRPITINLRIIPTSFMHFSLDLAYQFSWFEGWTVVFYKNKLHSSDNLSN